MMLLYCVVLALYILTEVRLVDFVLYLIYWCMMLAELVFWFFFLVNYRGVLVVQVYSAL